MILIIKSIPFYIQWRQVIMEWIVSGREGERDRGEEIRGLRDRA
jgi:hypothetical protein